MEKMVRANMIDRTRCRDHMNFVPCKRGLSCVVCLKKFSLLETEGDLMSPA